MPAFRQKFLCEGKNDPEQVMTDANSLRNNSAVLVLYPAGSGKRNRPFRLFLGDQQGIDQQRLTEDKESFRWRIGRRDCLSVRGRGASDPASWARALIALKDTLLPCADQRALFVPGVEFFVDFLYVRMHGVGADAQFVGNLLIGETVFYFFYDFFFAMA